MKQYSFFYLFTITITFLLIVFGFIVWRSEIYTVTFLNDETSKNFTLIMLGLSVGFTLYAIHTGIIRSEKRIDYLKLLFGAFVVLMTLTVIPLITLTYYLSGETSAYAASYTYSPGGHKSCAGAEVDDPDLGRNIKICAPEGHYSSDKVIFVSKKTNVLGAVILFAITTP
ncbi:hypothetical protein AAFN90_10150 [Erwiniaceae bacterium CAU 1747]